jgi:hypothetical protein
MAFMFRSHVFFSDDGRAIWDDPKRMLAARAGQTKNWWNPAWRDHLFGTVSWLAGGSDKITVPLGGGAAFEISTRPLSHLSPVSYLDPGEAGWSDEDDVRFENDEDGDDEDEIEE